MISGVVWCSNGFHRIECKITPGKELFEQQYFTEQYIILTRTEEGQEKDYTNLNLKTWEFSDDLDIVFVINEHCNT